MRTNSVPVAVVEGWGGNKMIDIHCHVLYGVDDGVQTLDDTRALKGGAMAEVDRIATPHQRKGASKPVGRQSKGILRQSRP